jgi:hypothetical protein
MHPEANGIDCGAGWTREQPRREGPGSGAGELGEDDTSAGSWAVTPPPVPTTGESEIPASITGRS